MSYMMDLIDSEIANQSFAGRAGLLAGPDPLERRISLRLYDRWHGTKWELLQSLLGREDWVTTPRI
jgi:hypothetical protein